MNKPGQMSDNHKCRTVLFAHHRGVTLVEILAALSIVGVSITTVLVAQAKCLQHLQVSGLELTSRQVANELLATWHLEQEDITVESGGDIDLLEGWSWSRSAHGIVIAEGVQLTEVTLEVIYRDPDGRAAPWVRPYSWLVDHGKQ